MNEAESSNQISILKCPKFGEYMNRMEIRGRILSKGEYLGDICITMTTESVKIKTIVRAFVNIDQFVNYIQL